MTPLTENPKIVVLINGDTITAHATNISADIEIIAAENAEEFVRFSQGLAFCNDNTGCDEICECKNR